jgi:hypothetical protein
MSQYFPAERLDLTGGLQLFAEPEREWLALARRGMVPPADLAGRALRLLAGALDAADGDDIVLTIDCVGVHWEAHVELTKDALAAQDVEQQLHTVLSIMPNRLDEYLSTTFNITDVATLFASATHRFGDAHALVSVPFRELKPVIDVTDGTTLNEQVSKLVAVLASMLGHVEPAGIGTFLFQGHTFEWHSMYDRVANDLIGAISLRG